MFRSFVHLFLLCTAAPVISKTFIHLINDCHTSKQLVPVGLLLQACQDGNVHRCLCSATLPFRSPIYSKLSTPSQSFFVTHTFHYQLISSSLIATLGGLAGLGALIGAIDGVAPSLKALSKGREALRSGAILVVVLAVHCGSRGTKTLPNQQREAVHMFLPSSRSEG